MPDLQSERSPLPDDFNTFKKPPLYFAVTRPIGTHTKQVTSALSAQLHESGYLTKEIKLSGLIRAAYRDLIGQDLPSVDREADPHNFSGHRALMRAGDMLRVALDNSIAARLAILTINAEREQVVQDAILNRRDGVAYIVTHLMHPDEVQMMRSVYGSRFFLIAINAPRKRRQDYLEAQFDRISNQSPDEVRADTRLGGQQRSKRQEISRDAVNLAKELISIDAGILSSVPLLHPKGRLNVDETFHLADLFIRSRAEFGPGEEPLKTNATLDASAVSQIVRFVNQICGDPFGTPTIQENAMAAAFLAAKSSVAMGRSVGAALVDTNDGSLIATGWNEVAKPSGGPYREGDSPDFRDHQRGIDPSDPNRIHAIRTFLGILFTPSSWREELGSIDDKFAGTKEWLENLADGLNGDDNAPSDAAVAGLSALEAFDNTRIMHLIEFGRSVHAEMAALSDAFRRSAGASSSTMFVTTFPCHECARNLVSFGIQDLYYVEPYGKSMAESLYSEEIVVFPDDLSGKSERRVRFIPFEGIAPARIETLFSPVKRKMSLRDGVKASDIGSKVGWELKVGSVRPLILAYPGEFEGTLNPEIEVGMLSLELFVSKETVGMIKEIADGLENNS